MNTHRPGFSAKIFFLLAAAALSATAQLVPPAEPAEEQPEILSRGPVHEAFAEPVCAESEESVVVTREPPPGINEVPPEDRPKGAQYVWIPGYWAWDDDRSDFIWVSACWRAAPPRMSWVPGYWAQAGGAWKWVPGFWTPTGVEDIAYLPVPPSISIIDPAGIQPSPDAIWIPPCMYWANGRYVLRSGYWLTARPDWIWIPSHYVLTPRGYVFVAGYWDYPLDNRGVLFAPVYFSSACRVATYTFSPGIVINLGSLRVNLFAYPRYRHYYFGDYYDSVYLNIGIYPWFDSRHHRTWHDPIFEHDRWVHHRSNPQWEQHLRDEYRHRFDDRTRRPARTFSEQETRRTRQTDSHPHDQVVRPLASTVSGGKSALKFEQINTETRQKLSQQTDHMRTYRSKRAQWESAPQDRTPAARPPFPQQQPAAPAPSGKSSIEPGKKTPQPAVKPSTGPDQSKPGEKTFVPPRTPPPQQPAKNVKPSVQNAPGKPAADPGKKPRPVPERIQVPSSPVNGTPAKRWIFNKNPPKQPASEASNPP